MGPCDELRRGAMLWDMKFLRVVRFRRGRGSEDNGTTIGISDRALDT
jgi:hypothetical protein